MEALNYPRAELRISRKGDGFLVWDIFRRRKIKLTPEEWVRQHVLHYLVSVKGYPSSLIASEYGIKVNDLLRRCDGVIFNREGQPQLIIECKAPDVRLTESVFHQIAQYNFELRVNWLVMTNGLDTIVAFIDSEQKRIDYAREIPSFKELLK